MVKSHFSGMEKDKIKRSEMIAHYGNGGQKVSDIMVFNEPFKIAWKVQYISGYCKSKQTGFADLNFPSFKVGTWEK